MKEFNFPQLSKIEIEHVWLEWICTVQKRKERALPGQPRLVDVCDLEHSIMSPAFKGIRIPLKLRRNGTVYPGMALNWTSLPLIKKPLRSNRKWSRKPPKKCGTHLTRALKPPSSISTAPHNKTAILCTHK